MNRSKEKIEADLKKALKSREELRLSTLRMISAALHNKEIEKRGRGLPSELTEEEVMLVLRSEVKKRKDAAEGFEKGGRVENAQKELDEMKIIESYLPAELSDDELEQIAADVVSGFGEVSIKDFGRVMGEMMKRVGGQASGDRVSAILKKFLQK